LRRLRGPALIVAMMAWAVAAHIGSAGIGDADFNAALAVAPLVLLVVVPLCRLPRLAAIAGGALLVAGLAWLWPAMRGQVALLYYLQHLGIHLALGALFGRSLFGPGEALATRMARSIYNGVISARKVRYTRGVTIAWTIFFFANALVSTLLFVFAPAEVWSTHANLLTGPLVGLMFAGELLCRRCLLPPEERPGLAQIIAAYRQQTASQPRQPDQAAVPRP
jgi:uncharacterized membrane protein